MGFSSKTGFFTSARGENWVPYPNLETENSTVGVWVKADASELTLSGSNVTNWTNKGSGGTDFSQATSSKQPIYDSTNACVTFDGVDDILQANSFNAYDHGPWTGSSGTGHKITCAVVEVDSYNSTPDGEQGRFFQVGGTPGGSAGNVYSIATGNSTIGWNNRFNNGSATFNNGVLNTKVLVSFRNETDQYQNYKFFLNGTEKSRNGGDNLTTINNIDNQAFTYLGGGPGANASQVFHSNIRIHELVGYEGFFAEETVRQEIEGYLAWEHGLQGDLPLDHPYKSQRPKIGANTLPDYNQVPSLAQINNYNDLIYSSSNRSALSGTLSIGEATSDGASDTVNVGIPHTILHPDGNAYLIPDWKNGGNIASITMNLANTTYLVKDKSVGWRRENGGGFDFFGYGYNGGTLGLDGNIYLAPANQREFTIGPDGFKTVNTIGIYNTVTNTLTEQEVTGANERSNLSGTTALAYEHALTLKNGDIMFLPKNEDAVLRYTPGSNVVTQVGQVYPQSRPNESEFGTFQLSSQGKVYLIPWANTHVYKYDPDANTFTSIASSITGAYCSATVDAAGNILCGPANVSNFLHIDTSTDTVSTKTYGLTMGVPSTSNADPQTRSAILNTNGNVSIIGGNSNVVYDIDTIGEVGRIITNTVTVGASDDRILCRHASMNPKTFRENIFAMGVQSTTTSGTGSNGENNVDWNLLKFEGPVYTYNGLSRDKPSELLQREATANTVFTYGLTPSGAD